MKSEIYRTFYTLILVSDLPDVFPIQRIDPDALYERSKSFSEKNTSL